MSWEYRKVYNLSWPWSTWLWFASYNWWNSEPPWPEPRITSVNATIETMAEDNLWRSRDIGGVLDLE